MKARHGDIYEAIEYHYLSWVWNVEGREAIRDHISYNSGEIVTCLGAIDWSPGFLFREDGAIRRLASSGGLVVFNGCSPANAELLRQFSDSTRGRTEFDDDVVELNGDFHIMVWCHQKDRKQYRKQYNVKRIGFLSDFWEIT